MTKLHRTIDSIWDMCYYVSFGLGAPRTDAYLSAQTSVFSDGTATDTALLTSDTAHPLVIGGICYVGVPHAAVYSQPAVSFDTIVTKVDYG